MAGRGASCLGRGALRYEGGGGGVGDGGGAPRWALLPSGLGRVGANVIEEVLGGPGSRRRRACGRGALTGLGGCLAAVLGFSWVAGVGLVGAWALVAAGLLAVGAGLGADFRFLHTGFKSAEKVLKQKVTPKFGEYVTIAEINGIVEYSRELECLRRDSQRGRPSRLHSSSYTVLNKWCNAICEYFYEHHFFYPTVRFLC